MNMDIYDKKNHNTVLFQMVHMNDSIILSNVRTNSKLFIAQFQQTIPIIFLSVLLTHIYINRIL